MTIVVASGKGGAGKTSVSAALAASYSAGCVVADCDVDAANGAIALGAKRRDYAAYYSGPGFSVDASKCAACGACERACRFDAVRRKAHAFEIAQELCERCGACLDRCPAGAIVAYERRSGAIMVSDTRAGAILAHAELSPGEDTSGKLVRKVRDRADEEARNASRATVIVDAPPGIGCPVIASISGADLAVVAVEASAAGIRDAERLLSLLESMGRRAIGIINKTGLSAREDAAAAALLARFGIEVVGRIPFDPALRSLDEAGATWLDAKGPAGNAVLETIEAIRSSAAGRGKVPRDGAYQKGPSEGEHQEEP
jgi:MinD superfamily P-loop ATPase